jgi:serine/threonine protein kinase
MGAVYEAADQLLRGLPVAVKRTVCGGDGLREQFEREAVMLSRLRHPALPRVSDHFTEDSGQFLVMDFIQGSDLAVLTREQGPFDAPRVLRFAETLLDALGYIHTEQPSVIHRDIKPKNIILTKHGKIVLVDFGLAKERTATTRWGESLHAYTLAYAPPEQIRGTGTDARSDLFSLGATLFHLLTGHPPVNAEVREEVTRQGVRDPLLRAVGEFPASVPAALTGLVAKAMALDPNERHQSAADMLKDLQVISPGDEETISSPRKKKPRLELQTFEFQTVRLDDQGRIVERQRKQARCFVENSGGGVKLEMVEVPENDRKVKLPAYARAGIAEAWLVDLYNDRVEVHSRPASGVYQEVRIVLRGQKVVSATIPQLKLKADDVLG